MTLAVYITCYTDIILHQVFGLIPMHDCDEKILGSMVVKDFSLKPKPMLLLSRQGPQKRSSAGAAGAIARQNTTTEDVEHVAGALWISAAARPLLKRLPLVSAAKSTE